LLRNLSTSSVNETVLQRRTSKNLGAVMGFVSFLYSVLFIYLGASTGFIVLLFLIGFCQYFGGILFYFGMSSLGLFLLMASSYVGVFSAAVYLQPAGAVHLFSIIVFMLPLILVRRTKPWVIGLSAIVTLICLFAPFFSPGMPHFELRLSPGNASFLKILSEITLFAFIAGEFLIFSWIIQRQRQNLLSMLDRNHRLITLISHDIKAPLTNSLRLSQRAPTIDTTERIRSGLVDALGMIDNIMITASVEEANPEIPHYPPFDLNLLIDRVLAGFQTRISDKKLILDRPEADEHCHVSGVDEDLFRHHVLNNLISNAIKFSPPGSTLQIRLLRNLETEALRLEIINPSEPIQWDHNGAPISSRGTEGERGTGLGLEIVSRTCGQLHLGFEFEGWPQGGARARVRFYYA
jgi:signal transduction histidine kinase